jgi:cytochrome d oxidase subunit CydB
MMPLDFVPLWTLILGFGVFMYVLMDGFDLGVGILFRRAPNDAARDIMMNSVAPIWDGNETWLVLGGVALLAAFPLAFAIILPALYFPILIMLMALIFRGVAFELRFKASLGCGFPLWFPGRHAGAGFLAWRIRAGVSGRWPLLRRRLVRLVDAFLGSDGD